MGMNVFGLVLSIVLYYAMRDDARNGNFDARFWQGFNAANIVWSVLAILPKLL